MYIEHHVGKVPKNLSSHQILRRQPKTANCSPTRNGCKLCLNDDKTISLFRPAQNKHIVKPLHIREGFRKSTSRTTVKHHSI